jgi:tryptophan-rich sensory protein
VTEGGAGTANADAPRGGSGALAVFLVIVAAAAFFGARFQPGDWYEALQKPPLTPPDRVFPVAWSLLYLAIAVAGWLVWRAAPRLTPALALWAAQLVLNALWSLLFFGLRRPGLALLEILVLLALVVGATLACFRVRALAGALLVPYALWVAFAAYLNAGILVLNPS